MTLERDPDLGEHFGSVLRWEELRSRKIRCSRPFLEVSGGLGEVSADTGERSEDLGGESGNFCRYMGAKPRPGKFLSTIYGAKPRLRSFCPQYMGAKPRLGRFLSIIHGIETKN
jgi:hypothetical protein